MTIIAERLTELETINLRVGHHHADEKKYCAMEAVAWLAGEPHSDSPACACQVISAYVRRLNDRIPDEQRQKLLDYIPKLAASRSTPAVQRARMYHLADAATRRFAPIALRQRGQEEEAKKLEGLAAITDCQTAREARVVALAIYRSNAAYAAATVADNQAAFANDAAYAAVYAAYAADTAGAACAAAYAAYAAVSRRRDGDGVGKTLPRMPQFGADDVWALAIDVLGEVLAITPA